MENLPTQMKQFLASDLKILNISIDFLNSTAECTITPRRIYIPEIGNISFSQEFEQYKSVFEQMYSVEVNTIDVVLDDDFVEQENQSIRLNDSPTILISEIQSGDNALFMQLVSVLGNIKQNIITQLTA